jgi:hypothetical protein
MTEEEMLRHAKDAVRYCRASAGGNYVHSETDLERITFKMLQAAKAGGRAEAWSEANALILKGAA